MRLNDRKISWLAGYSPRQVLFGRCGKSPLALHEQALLDREVIDDEVQKAFDEEQLKRVERSQPRIERQWTNEQLVLVRDARTDNTHLAVNKIIPKWLGPFMIRQVFNRSVTLSTLDGAPILEGQRVGFDMLKNWYGNPQPQEERSPDRSSDEDVALLLGGGCSDGEQGEMSAGSVSIRASGDSPPGR